LIYVFFKNFQFKNSSFFYKNIDNDYILSNNYKKIFLKKKYFYNLKLSVYLNNYLFYFKLNNSNQNIHFNNNLYRVFFFNKTFISFFFDFNFFKKNFLILDVNYSYIYPLYKHIYGKNTLSLYKNYFFFKPIFFTQKSWSYFFLKFCLYNNIKLLFISDFDYFSSFYKNFLNFDCSTSAIVPFNYKNEFIDYPLYSNNLNTLVKLIYFSTISQIFFFSHNNLNNFYKYKYLNNLYKFYKINYLN
jgi:hypothetical protein